ncbi:MAG: hypothetical protein LC732_11510, partial [Acidobacteria bacterium]|nr:hypothetical protein [Acidobacteriota bacterium]
MNLTYCFALAGTLAALLSGCAASTPPSPETPSIETGAPPAFSPPAASHAIHPELWPPAAAPLALDPGMERAIADLLRRMTLEEKVGQVIQPSITTITPEDVRTYKFGSVLNGGGGWPGDIRQARAADWLALADAFHEASMDTSGGRQAIPV